MPATLVGDDDSYRHFLSGYRSKVSPLTDTDKRIIDFSSQAHKSLAKRDAAIRSNFGMHSVDYYRRLESLKDHPQLGEQERKHLSNLMSTPGPMTGGAPILDSKQFSHGVNW